MAEVLDLRQFRSSQLEGLLQAETAEWSRALDWDYTASADLIRQYIEARLLPGYVLVERTLGRLQPLGYGFFIYEGHKGMLGNLFVAPAHRGAAHATERRLLEHMIATLCASPGLERIEAQLMPFPPGALAENFAVRGFTAYRRVFLELDLRQCDSPPPPNPGLEPWGGASFEEAARLILRAYADHVDGRINDQYRTFAGAVRFMHNIAHYPGCGNFDATSSFLARSLPGADLEGMILASRVKGDVAHITQVCVLPEQRRRGLGRALIAGTLAALRQQGMRAATLTVTEQNQPALTLYRQLGFRTLAEFDAYVWERPA
ncbi:MAG: GNAT family N-acetyltransferase [Terriglobales bacterium]